MSNEHLDMSGNPCDAPFICEWCERDFPEERAYGVDGCDYMLFCSAHCAEMWQEKNRLDGEAN